MVFLLASNNILEDLCLTCDIVGQIYWKYSIHAELDEESALPATAQLG